MRTSKRSKQAAATFLRLLCPHLDVNDPCQREYEIILLVEGAFALYEADWPGGWDIRHWNWPAQCLHEGLDFPGNTPWSVLLRTAATLLRESFPRLVALTNRR